MSLEHLSIWFDNQQATFFPGQQVSGQVRVCLVKQKRMRGIRLRFRGKCDVQWSETRSETTLDGKSETVTDYYTASETYFENSTYVYGGPNDDLFLAPGEYVYPFLFVLPSTLPSSFEGQYGNVRYTVKVAIDRPWRFDHECKAAFTVVTLLDLNTKPHLQERTQQAGEKVLCCGCCSSPPISAVVTLPCQGFVPGQKCNVIVEVDNPTTEQMTVKCGLFQVNTYKSSNGSTKTETKEITFNKMGDAKRESKVWTSDIKIPAVPNSYLNHCKYIDISYNIVVRGMFDGMHRSLYIKSPIVIGSIPFRTYFDSIIPTAPDLPKTDEMGNTHPSGASPEVFNQFSNYPDIPPPSYEECVYGKANIRGKDDNEYVLGDMTFAPCYPIYNFK